MSFKCIAESTPQGTTLKISGYVNEHAKFPNVERAPIVTINLDGVTGLNSIGTRNWLIWVKNGLPDSPILITHAPTLFVKMFGEVQGTLTERIRVDSFYVPFYSDDTGERKDVLFERGKTFDQFGNIKQPSVTDSAGKPMDLDVLPNFFNFLKAKT